MVPSALIAFAVIVILSVSTRFVRARVKDLASIPHLVMLTPPSTRSAVAFAVIVILSVSTRLARARVKDLASIPHLAMPPSPSLGAWSAVPAARLPTRLTPSNT